MLYQNSVDVSKQKFRNNIGISEYLFGPLGLGPKIYLRFEVGNSTKHTKICIFRRPLANNLDPWDFRVPPPPPPRRF
jgi:hypothetical protein